MKKDKHQIVADFAKKHGAKIKESKKIKAIKPTQKKIQGLILKMLTDFGYVE